MIKLLIESTPRTNWRQHFLTFVDNMSYVLWHCKISFCPDLGCLGRVRVFPNFDKVKNHDRVMHSGQYNVLLLVLRRMYYGSTPFSFCPDLDCLGRGRVSLNFDEIKIHLWLMHMDNKCLFCKECHFITRNRNSYIKHTKNIPEFLYVSILYQFCCFFAFVGYFICFFFFKFLTSFFTFFTSSFYSYFSQVCNIVLHFVSVPVKWCE